MAAAAAAAVAAEHEAEAPRGHLTFRAADGERERLLLLQLLSLLVRGREGASPPAAPPCNTAPSVFFPAAACFLRGGIDVCH